MKKILVLILYILLIGTGCEKIDFGDTNKNVNGPAELSTAQLFSGAITNFSTRAGRPYRINPTLYVQYFMQLVYNEEMLYADVAGYWQSYYVQVLSNLNEIIEICSDPQSADSPVLISNGAIENQLAVAMIFKSVVFKRVTDLFGDIPYSEALDPDILMPAYDSQEDIYKSMIADVKAARDMIDTGKAGSKGDVIYNGDMAKWQRFANSFLMSLTLQLSKVYPGSSGFAANEFLGAVTHPAGMIETLDDEAWYTYDVLNSFDNPWNWMRPADYGMTREFLDAMKGNGFTSNSMRDNRIDLFVADPSIEGLPYGYSSYSGSNSQVAPVIIDAGTSLPLLTAAYSYLHRAEGAARGWSTEDVSEMLDKGIKMSYISGQALYDPDNELNIGDGAAYAAARVADMATAPGGALQVIGEEKWIALFPLGYDAWSEWRRTGYPALTPAADALNNGEIPRRYNYPSSEPTLNSPGYNSGVSALSPSTDNNTSRMWWDQ